MLALCCVLLCNHGAGGFNASSCATLDLTGSPSRSAWLSVPHCALGVPPLRRRARFPPPVPQGSGGSWYQWCADKTKRELRRTLSSRYHTAQDSLLCNRDWRGRPTSVSLGVGVDTSLPPMLLYHPCCLMSSLFFACLQFCFPQSNYKGRNALQKRN